MEPTFYHVPEMHGDVGVLVEWHKQSISALVEDGATNKIQPLHSQQPDIERLHWTRTL